MGTLIQYWQSERIRQRRGRPREKEEEKGEREGARGEMGKREGCGVNRREKRGGRSS